MKPIRSLKTDKKELFLTFDDGPCVETTPKILETLDKLKAKATFYVVGTKALAHKSLVKEILEQGHAIGDHSMDHGYRHFFGSHKHYKNWVAGSQNSLKTEFNIEPSGFRSPAGVITPPLAKTLEELDIPWVHWNRRFFDSQFEFSNRRFKKKLMHFSAGDIILLHDAQKERLRAAFLQGLEAFVSELKDKGFDFEPITIKRLSYANR